MYTYKHQYYALLPDHAHWHGGPVIASQCLNSHSHRHRRGESSNTAGRKLINQWLSWKLTVIKHLCIVVQRRHEYMFVSMCITFSWAQDNALGERAKELSLWWPTSLKCDGPLQRIFMHSVHWKLHTSVGLRLAPMNMEYTHAHLWNHTNYTWT